MAAPTPRRVSTFTELRNALSRRSVAVWWMVLGLVLATPLISNVTVQGAAPDIRIDTTMLAFVPVTNRQIFVELDWMETAGHSHKPSQAVIDGIVQTFAREGFTITIDVSNAVPEQAMIDITGSPSNSPSVQAIKSTYFNHSGDSRYFYSLWAHNYSYFGGSTGGSSGIADLPGNTHLVSLGSFSGQTGTMSNQIGTFIHEFGHNLGQLHGGSDNGNYKPNYISIMNYFYQLNGVGPSLVALGFANTGSGFNTFGYSHGLLGSLNEGSLDESVGIGLGRTVDWNCDNVISSSVSKDVQWASRCGASNSGLSVLTDYDNWSFINGFVSAGITPSSVTGDVSPLCVTPADDQPIRDAVEGLRAQGVLPAEETLVAAPNAQFGPAADFFDVINDGSATLSVTGLSLDSPAPWITWEPQSFNVAPGQSQRVHVYVNFATMPPGQTTRRLLVASNDSDENPYPTGVYITAGLPTAADVNGDGRSDLLFESTSGSLNAWYMDGLTRLGGTFLSPSTIDPNLLVVGMRDFTGDGKPDLLLQHQQTGAAVFYKMDHETKVAEQTIPIGANTPWRIVATGDVNNDGSADIIWEHFGAGQFYVWFMKPSLGTLGNAGSRGDFSGDYLRTTPQTIVSLGPTGVRIIGTGDVNSDGLTDILLQDDASGALQAWVMNGTTVAGALSLSPAAVNPAWKARAVADYNGDGRPDLLFQNASTGGLYMWFMNGLTLGASGFLSSPSVNPSWQVVGPR
ncbi:MAG: FG-GAP-like repeat-containing protein [Acidobacteriota bacterium]